MTESSSLLFHKRRRRKDLGGMSCRHRMPCSTTSRTAAVQSTKKRCRPCKIQGLYVHRISFRIVDFHSSQMIQSPPPCARSILVRSLGCPRKTYLPNPFFHRKMLTARPTTRTKIQYQSVITEQWAPTLHSCTMHRLQVRRKSAQKPATDSYATNCRSTCQLERKRN